MATEAGGKIRYKIVEGFGHELAYAPEHFPLLVKWLSERKREPFPRRVYWEAGKASLGSCRWLRIDQILPEPAATWHRDWNCPLVDDRISIGFYRDDDFEGMGVRVARLAEGDNTATRRRGSSAAPGRRA